MSYLVFARKFRPQTFQSIIGQEHITRALATAIIRNRVPHALLLTGPRGVGKTSAARVFARALNCTGRSAEDLSTLKEEQALALVEPCGSCVNCQEIARSGSVAVWEVDGASNNSVDNVRELIESLRSLPPPGSKYKIYIIDEVHMLSVAAFNALLKSLEEPPPHTVFIFATTEPHKIPETVISRCQRHDFRSLSSTLIIDWLKEIVAGEGVAVDDDVLRFVAERSEGGMRDAQSMLDRLLVFSQERIDLPLAQQVFGVLDRKFFVELSQHILAQDAASCFTLLDQAFSQSLNLRAFIADFITHFRNLLVLSSLLKKQDSFNDRGLTQLIHGSADELKQLRNQVEQASDFDFERLFDIAEKIGERALSSSFPRFVLEAGVSRMASLPSLRPLAEILSQLKNSGGKEALAVKPAGPPIAKQIERRGPEKSPERNGDFNPTWEAFVHHVQSRTELVLAAFLRRVSPVSFARGKLLVKASQFDLSSLKDPHTVQTIKACLYSYSGEESWDVDFVLDDGAREDLGNKSELRTEKTNTKVKKREGSGLVEGSLAAQQENERAEYEKRVDDEARHDPLVQSALQTFGGSSIEKVSVVRRS